MLRALAVLALVLAPSLAPAQGIIYDPGSQWYRPGSEWVPWDSVVAVADWTTGFGSSSWYGAPTPTIDCRAVPDPIAGGTLECSGATVTKVGTPALVGSPWYPSGWTGAQQKAVRLDGTAGDPEFFDLGNVGGAATALTVCGEFSTSATDAAYYSVLSKYSANNSWFVMRYTGSTWLFVCDGTDCTPSGVTSLTAGGLSAWCASYTYVGPGSSILRANLNGTAASEVTNARGPITSTASSLLIGDSANTAPWVGDVSRITVWNNWAASATELAGMVKGQIGLLEQKPAGTALTHTRSDSTLCGPYPDNGWYWLAPNVPCVKSSGVEVFGVASNGLAYSEVLVAPSWSEYTGGTGGTVATTANAVAAPDGATTADRWQLSATSGQTAFVYQGSSLAAGSITASLWVKGVSGSGTLNVDFYDSSTKLLGTCPFTTTWSRCSVTATAAATVAWVGFGFHNGLAQTGSVDVHVWGAQAHSGSVALPYRATAGSAYSGAASTATTLTMPVSLTNPAGWAVLAKGTPALSWPTSGTLLSLGAYPNNGTAALRADALSVVDAAGNEAYRIISPSVGERTLLLSSLKFGTIDGTRYDLSAGTGLGYFATMPTTIYIGARSGSAYFQGTVSRVVQCKKAGGCR